MSEGNPSGGRQTYRWLEPGRTNVRVIYILYLVGIAMGVLIIPFFVVIPLCGVLLAYKNRKKKDFELDTHYTWAIRTFWIAMLGILVSALMMVGFLAPLFPNPRSATKVASYVGVVIGTITLMLMLVRSVIGLRAIRRNKPIRNPESWVI